MASSVIHMCVASEVNKKLKRDNSKILIGTIAPDISKLLGEDKTRSHFLDEEDTLGVPNLKRFLDKYKNKLLDDFVLGYYIHLYTDFLWFKYFMTEISDENYVTKLDGTKIKLNGKMLIQYTYNDYTNMNALLFDEYDINCKIFYNEIPEFENNMKNIYEHQEISLYDSF